MEKGDYVLATKYRDGDPLDQWAVGFFGGYTKHNPNRYIVLDENGIAFRGNGFRKAVKITADQGAAILGHKDKIELYGISIWRWLKIISA